MTEVFTIIVDKNDVVDLACAIERGDRTTAADALNRLLSDEIGETANPGMRLVEWVAQGRALAAKQAAA